MFLLTRYLEKESTRLRDEGVRTSVIGRRDRLSPGLLSAIELAETRTLHCSRLHFRLAIDYSARAAILEAARKAAEAAREAACGGRIQNDLFEDTLPVDLLIRTGGEQRLSDFLLWESAYAELIFTKRMWPDFTPADLRAAVGEYHRRDRRFGGVSGPVVASDCACVTTERWLR